MYSLEISNRPLTWWSGRGSSFQIKAFVVSMWMFEGVLKHWLIAGYFPGVLSCRIPYSTGHYWYSTHHTRKLPFTNVRQYLQAWTGGSLMSHLEFKPSIIHSMSVANQQKTLKKMKKWPNKQRNKQTNKQTNKQRKKQTNKTKQNKTKQNKLAS